MTLPKRTLKQKMNLQRGRCFYCGDKLTEKIEIDHIIPKSVGGNSERTNLCLSCVVCNRKKGYMSVNNFKVIMANVLIRGLFYFEFIGLKNGEEYETIY